MTLRRREDSRPSAFAEVEVAVAREHEVVVHDPRGLRLEGLDLDQVVALWLRLS